MAVLPSSSSSANTTTTTIIGIVKAMVGPAILYLPHSFSNAGYAVALLLLLICLLMYLYSSLRLLQSHEYIIAAARQQQDENNQGALHNNSSKSTIEMTSLVDATKNTTSTINDIIINDACDDDPLDTSATGSSANDIGDSTSTQNNSVSYPQLANIAHGKVGQMLVQCGITCMQLGICLTYCIFIPHNLAQCLQSTVHISLPTSVIMWLVLILELPLCCIKDLSKLSTTNTIANGLISFGLLSCLYLAITTILSPDDNVDNAESSTLSSKRLSPWNNEWYLFIGTSVLLFEGSITLCLPLQQSHDKNSKGNSNFTSIYMRTISCIVLFYALFGMICWSAFTPKLVPTVFTTALPSGILATLVQLAYSIAVILTFPLQLYPALEIIVAKTRPAKQQQPQQQSRHRMMTVGCILFVLGIIAIVEMQNLGRVVALMGSLLGCPLAFCIPPMLHSKIVTTNNRQTKLCNTFVTGLGFLAMVGATTATILTWDNHEE